MGREMIRWRITEKVTNIFGETNEYHVGWVDATTEQAALNKARKKFKWDRDGIPNRRRNPDNFCAWNPLFMMKGEYYGIHYHRRQPYLWL